MPLRLLNCLHQAGWRVAAGCKDAVPYRRNHNYPLLETKNEMECSQNHRSNGRHGDQHVCLCEQSAIRQNKLIDLRNTF